MDKEMKGRIVTLGDLWDIFLDHIWAILIVALICMAGVNVVNRVVIKPLYQSRATLYILRQDNEPNYIYTQSDFSLAKDVVNDCTYVLKSEEVLNDVIRKLDLDQTFRQLQGQITTNNPENTRFLEVMVKSDSPEQAKQIADIICDAASEKITEAMGFDQVNLFSYGTLPNHRCNGIGLLKTLFIGAVAAVLVYAIYLVVFLLDISLRTEEDVSKYLGISTLAEIPNSETGSTRRGKKYSYRSSRKYKGRYYAYGRAEQTGDGKLENVKKGFAKKGGRDKK